MTRIRLCPRAAILLNALLLVGAAPIQASPQESSPSSMVLTWTEGATRPKATLDDVRWLEGEWEGKLESAMQQHTAFSPVSGHMPGFARAWGSDGAIWFYEINDFVEVDGSLEFRVKHFSGELASWEDQFVRHRLIAIRGQVLYFDGITLVKEGPRHYTVYVRIANGERKGQVVVVHQSRVSKR
jgi:hypothetical protein